MSGLQCVHCGRFVGFEATISLETGEYGSPVFSIEAECQSCRPNEARKGAVCFCWFHKQVKQGMVAYHDTSFCRSKVTAEEVGV